MKLTSLGSSKRRLSDGGRMYPHNCNSRENVVGVISNIGPFYCFPGGEEINLGSIRGDIWYHSGLATLWEEEQCGGRRLMWLF